MFIALLFAILTTQAPTTPEPASIVVTGEGVVKIAPDQAWVRISTESRSKNSKEAQQRNAEVMTAVNDLDAYITCRPDSFDLPLTEMVRQKVLSPAISRHKLYRNDKGRFKEIGLQAGITNTFGYALSVVTSDVNNDGYTDIFVANDFAAAESTTSSVSVELSVLLSAIIF